MAITTISDLFTPDIWINGAAEKMAKYPSFINSGVIASSSLFDQIASGAGISANIPFFKDITDDSDGVQAEDTAPTPGEITTATQICTILNREKAYRSTALARQVSGQDPVNAVLQQLAAGRAKRFQSAAVSVLRGAFNGLGLADAAAPLSATRVDSFDESGTDATTEQSMSADLFITAKALMGELSNDLAGGAIITHSNVVAQLEINDKGSFRDGVESNLPFTVRTYRGVPIFVSDNLVRAGVTNGYVYETYILAPGVLAIGMKGQTNSTDVSSLQYWNDPDKNNETIYDRNRFMVHLNGMRWGGSPSAQSATNAELYTASNWTLVYSSAPRVGAVCIRTNK